MNFQTNNDIEKPVFSFKYTARSQFSKKEEKEKLFAKFHNSIFLDQTRSCTVNIDVNTIRLLLSYASTQLTADRFGKRSCTRLHWSVTVHCV